MEIVLTPEPKGMAKGLDARTRPAMPGAGVLPDFGDRVFKTGSQKLRRGNARDRYVRADRAQVGLNRWPLGVGRSCVISEN